MLVEPTSRLSIFIVYKNCYYKKLNNLFFQTPTSPIEILNTRFQPRNLGNKKSEFLRALRKENNGSEKHESSMNKGGWGMKVCAYLKKTMTTMEVCLCLPSLQS